VIAMRTTSPRRLGVSLDVRCGEAAQVVRVAITTTGADATKAPVV
jgi:hypothetical protein